MYWCFLKRAGYEPAPGFTFSISFIIIPHNTITVHKHFHTHSHHNLNFPQYTIQILVPHVMWSAQAVCEWKIDHTSYHLSSLRGTPKRLIVQLVGIRTHTNTILGLKYAWEEGLSLSWYLCLNGSMVECQYVKLEISIFICITSPKIDSSI